MRSILVMNAKGGSGKTTIATNLAVYYALEGKKTSPSSTTIPSAAPWIGWRAVPRIDRPSPESSAGNRVRECHETPTT